MEEDLVILIASLQAYVVNETVEVPREADHRRFDISMRKSENRRMLGDIAAASLRAFRERPKMPEAIRNNLRIFDDVLALHEEAKGS